MSTCTKAFSIVIGGTCVDWSALAWGAPSGVGSTTWTPAAATFTAAGTSADVTASPSTLLVNGTLLAPVASCNCQLDLSVAITCGLNASVGRTVLVVDNVTSTILLNSTGDGASSGTFNIPFTIPAGHDIVIVVSFDLFSTGADTAPATINMTGTFSVV